MSCQVDHVLFDQIDSVSVLKAIYIYTSLSQGLKFDKMAAAIERTYALVGLFFPNYSMSFRVRTKL